MNLSGVTRNNISSWNQLLIYKKLLGVERGRSWSAFGGDD